MLGHKTEFLYWVVSVSSPYWTAKTQSTNRPTYFQLNAWLLVNASWPWGAEWCRWGNSLNRTLEKMQKRKKNPHRITETPIFSQGWISVSMKLGLSLHFWLFVLLPLSPFLFIGLYLRIFLHLFISQSPIPSMLSVHFCLFLSSIFPIAQGIHTLHKSH